MESRHLGINFKSKETVMETDGLDKSTAHKLHVSLIIFIQYIYILYLTVLIN